MHTSRYLFRSARVGAAAVLLAMTAVACVAVARAAEPSQAADADLRGVVRVRVTATQTTPDATNCGIDLRRMLPMIEKEVEGGGLKLTDGPSTLVTLTLLTTYDADRQSCATAAMLGAYRRVTFFDDAGGQLRSGYVVLWQRGSQITTGLGEHPPTAEQRVGQLAAAFIETWRRQNGEGAK